MMNKVHTCFCPEGYNLALAASLDQCWIVASICKKIMYADLWARHFKIR